MKIRHPFSVMLAALIGTALTSQSWSAPPAPSAQLTLAKGDHICYIGNTLADRMQHDGWLETLLQTRFPELELVFRNLGFSADELTLRPRSLDFGSPDVHLAHSQADVIFAFFGYNESFADEAGLPAFNRDLRAFIAATLAQKYNGTTPPRIVLFSPIATEDLHDPNLPDGTDNNRRLALYSQAIAAVAAEAGIPFVDLFAPSQKLYADTAPPLTINGIHLTPGGNRAVATVIDQSLFGTPTAAPDRLDAVRAAVLEKNRCWFRRYRATDGYSTYGKRAYLKFVGGQTNFDVMQNELKMLDVMTANRDPVIWAAVRGQAVTVDDSNVPAPVPVISNVGGGSDSSNKAKEGSLHYLGGEEAIGKMTLAKGMSVNLFASEEQFPELINPVQSAVDLKGRLWVSAWQSYPHSPPMEALHDKLLIFPDDNGDGKADRCVVFADGLANPTGFEFWNNGVLVACQPDVYFLQDTDGDDKADVKICWTQGFDSADTHCGANSFVYGPDGCMYLSEGIFHYTNIESPWGKPLRTEAPMLYRWNPRSQQISNHFVVSPNPHGIVIDDWGNLFCTDGTTGRGFYVGFPEHRAPHDLYVKRVRPVAGFGRLSGTHFPEENQGNLLICNTIGVLGVLQHKVNINGADFTSTEVDPILVSSDGNFRPTDVEIGGDGALYVLDWQNVIIGHMQHNLRDPNRDHSHGRIYRVTADGRPLLKPLDLAALSTPDLIAQLRSPEPAVRYRTRIALSGRKTDEVLAALTPWAAGLDGGNAADAPALLEAVWLQQQHNRVNIPLLQRALASPVAEARAAAVRVVGQSAAKWPEGVAALQAAAKDPEARVRHEALVAAVQYANLPAAEVLFAVAAQPLDPQLTFDVAECRKIFEPLWKAALQSGGKLSPAGLIFTGTTPPPPVANTDGGPPPEAAPAGVDAKLFALGREVYSREAHCATCHQPDGKGTAGVYPPLAKSNWVASADTDRMIKIALNGMMGPITVNGVDYSATTTPPMTPFKDLLSDREIAAVLTYTRNAWGNRGTAIAESDVARVRKLAGDRIFWNAAELLKLHPFMDEEPWAHYLGGNGPGKGKKVVIIAADKEYRSEEAMPMLGRILAERHGFDVTVLFSVDPATGEIAPEVVNNIPGLEKLATADLLIAYFAFRDLPPEQTKCIDDYTRSGRPIIAIRPTVAAFVLGAAGKAGPYAHYDWHYAGPEKAWKGGWAQVVLGQTWINHHGKHRHQSTVGRFAEGALGHAVLHGIGDGDIWASTDTYATPQPVPADWQVLLRGEVHDRVQPYTEKDPDYGLRATDPVTKETAKNTPMMPVVWLRTYQQPDGGKQGTCLVTTMGASCDYQNEAFRRLNVNAAYHLLGLPVPEKADVDIVGTYKPTPYAFKTYTRGLRPALQ